MSTYKAIGKKIIGVLTKLKDKTNGEYVQDSGLICAGSDLSAKTDFEKFKADVISVGADITEVKVGDVVQVKQFVGEILSEEEEDDKIVRTVVFEANDILAVII